MRRTLAIGALLAATGTIALGYVATRLVRNPALAQDFQPDPAFEGKPVCERLEIIDKDGKSVLDYIIASGVEQFSDDVRNGCRNYLRYIEEAEIRAGIVVPTGSDREETAMAQPKTTASTTPVAEMSDAEIRAMGLDPNFERQPACQRLEKVEEDGKSVFDYIIASGPENFINNVGDCTQYMPIVVTAARRAAVPIPSSMEGIADVDTTLNPAFEDRSACDRLRIIDADGKSVRDYMVASGLDDFAEAIETNCNEFQDELEEAERYFGAAIAIPVSNISQLSPCEQLNAVNARGDSVAQYIADSDYDTFASAINNTCPVYSGELTEAQRIIEDRRVLRSS